MKVPLEKFKEIKEMYHSWASIQFCTKSQLQSLLGSLLYVSKCVCYSRFFLNRMLQTLREHQGGKHIKLTDDFKRDLAWFNKVLHVFNGSSFYK